MARKTSRETWGIIDALASGRYRARYTHEGERFKAPTTFDGKGDARAWLAGIRSDIQRGKWKNPNTIQAETFKLYALAWIEQRVTGKGEHLRENTKAEYLRYLERGLSTFADARLSEISPAAVRAWHLQRSKAGKTAAALEARLLHAVLKTAEDDGIIERNPVASPLLKTSAGKAHRAPTPDELALMLGSMKQTAPRLRLALLLAAYGGLRLSEWRALRRMDLQHDGERFNVTVSRQASRSRADWGQWIVGPPKSAEGVRVVHLPASLADDVTEHLEEHVKKFPGSLLFTPAGTGDFLDDRQFYVHWNKAREDAGVRRKVSKPGEPVKWMNDVQEHDLRAYAGTMYAQGGATLRETMAFLGHSTTEAAMLYQRTTGRAAELADRMPAPAIAPASVPSLAEKRAERGTS